MKTINSKSDPNLTPTLISFETQESTAFILFSVSEFDTLPTELANCFH